MQATMTIDALPPRVQNWHGSATYARRHHARVRDQFWARDPEVPDIGMAPTLIRYGFTLPTHRVRDLDNLIAGCKVWVDEILRHNGTDDTHVQVIMAAKNYKKGVAKTSITFHWEE